MLECFFSSFLFCVVIFHSVLVQCCSFLFCLGCWRAPFSLLSEPFSSFFPSCLSLVTALIFLSTFIGHPKLFVLSNDVDFVVVLFSFLWLFFFTQFLFNVVCSVMFRVLQGSFLSSECDLFTLFPKSLLTLLIFFSLSFLFCGYFSLISCSVLFVLFCLGYCRAPFSFLSATFSCSFPGPSFTEPFYLVVVF